jgi:dienelactone hydrolase
MKLLPALLFLALPLISLAQPKPLSISDVHRWRRIEQPHITPDGAWVAYALAPTTEGDSSVQLYQTAGAKTTAFERATRPRFTEDGQWLVFRIKPPLDTLKAQRRRKMKDDDLTKDSLGLYHLATGRLEKMPRVRSYTLPEKYAGWLAFQLEPDKPAKKDTSAVKPAVPDSAQTAAASTRPAPKKSGKKIKKEGKDNGSRLVIRHLATGRQDTLAFVQSFVLAKRAPRLLLHTTGRGDSLPFAARPGLAEPGIYLLDLEKNSLRPLYRAKGKYQQLALDDHGRQAAFLADTDTTKARLRPWKLGWWAGAADTARVIADTAAAFLPRQWRPSEHGRIQFAEDGSKLYFAMAPPPVLNDTTLLPEEIVNVEVWTSGDPRMYTEQNKRLEAERKRSYPAVWHTRTGRFVALGGPDLPEWRFQTQRDADRALAFSEEPYLQSASWEGAARKDVYAVDLKTGQRQLVVNGRRVQPSLSPGAAYVVWWSDPDSAWYAWKAANGATARLTDWRSERFFNEETDVPDYPGPYGLAAWMAGDEAVLLYDRFDIWKIDPDGKKAPLRLTRGRETQTAYRYVRLDPDEHFVRPGQRLLLHQVNDRSKDEGYAWLDLGTGKITPWLDGPYAYSRQPLKARTSDHLLFTRQNYHTFPDLHLVRLNEPPAAIRQVSRANPQQGEYQWGSIELVEWTSLTGEKLRGLLVKPDGFDPARQYPMVVNFYERLSDGFHQHRAPDVHRSNINWTMYASRGYLVFVPDIPYRTGYPGESAYNAVVSGVTALMNRGFVDPRRIGLQGHSWGGYQAAYLVTRTNLFACAEAGAPVVNMTSAYGGIRWESGLSRMFQYERQQSRIGGTLWEYPLRYLENSPLFSLDKVQTPLLILHNDKDGAVPWYQGIEMFSALRRLGKPAWLLNYNDEPHWPVKLQNRIDFQTRLQQFLDHYLMGAPMPRWMQRGVPPLEKGILQGLEVEPVSDGRRN